MNSNYILFFVFSFFFRFGFSSPIVDTVRIEFNEKNNIFISKNPTVYFFCPTLHINEEKYFEQFWKLIGKRKIQKIDSVEFIIVLFKENQFNPSKGAKCSFNSDSLIINDFSVLFMNFDSTSVLKNHQRIELKKYFEVNFVIKNFSQVSLLPSIACFNNLAERIPQYENFISELINPIYSEVERISFLEDSIKKLNNQLDILFDRLNKLDTRLEKLESEVTPINTPTNENRPSNKKGESKEESPNPIRRMRQMKKNNK
jgi:hypothetical protein